MSERSLYNMLADVKDALPEGAHIERETVQHLLDQMAIGCILISGCAAVYEQLDSGLVRIEACALGGLRPKLGAYNHTVLTGHNANGPAVTFSRDQTTETPGQ